MLSNSEIEKINLNLDINCLKDQILEIAQNYSSISSTPQIDTWAFLSRNGRFDNPFDGKLPCINGPMDRNPSAAELTRFGVQRKSQDSIYLTQLCQGYVKQVLEKIDSLGFWPRAARINCLKPKTSTIKHRDTVIDQYAVSLHIPVITNKDCYAVIGKGRYHLEADGSIYLCNINQLHQFYNDSSDLRYHIIMAAWDTKACSQNFRYQYDYIPQTMSIDWNQKLLFSA